MTEVSIKDVARLAGVSVATVSRCVNNPEKLTDKTRLLVQEAILQTGYRPNVLARSFRRGRTYTVTVVLASIGDPYYSLVVRGIRTVAKSKGYMIAVIETRLGEQLDNNIDAMLASIQTDGIILLVNFVGQGNPSFVSPSRQRVPIILGYESDAATKPRLHSFGIDNYAAAKEAVEYLITNGHTRIAMISGEKASSTSKYRESGYRSAMKSATLEVINAWIVEGQWTIDGGRNATRLLLDQRPTPTAIFCANDEMALGCLHELKSAGLSIPADISVIGFDDVRYAEVADPPLTTVRQPAEQIGRHAMRRLLEIIEDGTQPAVEPEIVPYKLIIRQSVARPVDID